MEEHSIGSQYKDGSLEEVARGAYFGSPLYEYVEYELPRSDADSSFIVQVNSKGLIAAIFGCETCSSREEAIGLINQLEAKIKDLYRDKLIDCGAQRSELTADISLEQDTIVSYSLKSLEYLKAIEKKDVR